MCPHTLREIPPESNTGQGNKEVRRALCKSCKANDVYTLPRVSTNGCATRATSLWARGLQGTSPSAEHGVTGSPES